jgi:glycosyltransferase involved in cell wall biosynthesis
VAAPLVLHVLPVDRARGAQTYARALCDALDGPAGRHRVVALFGAPGPGPLRPDHALGVPPGALRRLGLDPRAVLRLRALVAAERPAAVVAHGGEPLKYAVAAGVPRARLAYYKIGNANARLAGARRALHRLLLGRAGVVAAVSDDAAAEARDLGVPASRLHVIPNGRDPARFAGRGDRHDPAAPVRLVFVGQLEAGKRPERFVELVAALRGRGAPVEAAIAGDGPLLDALADRARGAGVDLLGTVDDVPALLARSDVLVLTSLPREGMPGVLVEAGLAGLPVVTTAVPGAAEVVVDGETGAVVGVDDFDALVERTDAFVRDADLRARTGAAARERCVERFGIERGARQWRALLAGMTGATCTSST